MKANRIVPEYGPLSTTRVLGTGSLIAMPFAAGLLADFGAEVITIERPGRGDNFRYFAPVIEGENGQRVGTGFMQDARNRLSMTLELDLSDPDAREIFYGLIRQSDIYIENMVWLERLGIRDSDLLALNPKLVIVHISGFGRPAFGGIPEICDRASYDMIGQAYSGYIWYNGYPDRPPLNVKPSMNDYVTAMFALFGALTAYHYAQRTGIGQVVDVAQFEAQAKIMRDTFVNTCFDLPPVQRAGNRSVTFQPWDIYTSADGIYVALGANGPVVFRRFVEAVGFDERVYTHEAVSKDAAAVDSPLGREFAQKVVDWCAAHTAEEIEETLTAHKVPVSRINTAEDCMRNPHYRSRNDFVNYMDQTTGYEITAFGIAPKLSETPGRIWRGAPSVGQDTDLILKELLGYSEEEIAVFRSKGIV